MVEPAHPEPRARNLRTVERYEITAYERLIDMAGNLSMHDVAALLEENLAVARAGGYHGYYRGVACGAQGAGCSRIKLKPADKNLVLPAKYIAPQLP